MMFIIVLSLMFGSRGVYGDGHCSHTQTFPLGPHGHAVRFNGRECDADFDHLQSHVFCSGSGWGDKEATVVCRDQLHSHYGIGGYIHIDPMEVGLPYVNCSGSEGALEECVVAETTTNTPCPQAGIIRQCLNVSQVYVSRTEDYEPFDYVEVSEGGPAQFCLVVWGPLSETLHVHVETTNSGYAVANFDYIPLRQTVTFESTESVRSQQCLKIELIDDSLAEFWEMFSVTLSTNSSSVNITRQEFNIYINPNDGSCSEGGVTGVRDADNSSLELVEACDSSKGTWSALCDREWTLQDVAVVCRGLGYQELGAHKFSTLHRDYFTSAIYECSGNETSLASCPTLSTEEEIICQFLLVDCQNGDKMSDNPKNSTGDVIDNSDANKTDVISVGDGRDNGEESDSGEDGEGGGGDKDNGASGDNKDTGRDKTGVSSGGSKADDGSKNSGDVLSSGSGSDPTVDNTEKEKTSLPPEVQPTTVQIGAVSVAVFSAITASVVVFLLLLFTVVFVLVYMKRRRKRAASSTQVGDSTNTTNQSNPQGECVGEKGGRGEKHLDNPTYDASLESPHSPQAGQMTEHNVLNPLYDLNSDSTDTRLYAVLEPPDYAILECPSYSLPDKLSMPSTTTEPVNIDDGHNYDYADIPDGKPNDI